MPNIPAYPSFLPMPFASSGARRELLTSASAPGRASYAEGFPTETQMPLKQGGVAPNRLDFNEVLYLLSTVACWQQTGGQWNYDAARNYQPPCMVVFGGVLWWCLKQNGPDTGGLVEPGTDDTIWKQFFDFSSPRPFGGSLPVPTIIYRYTNETPEGFLPCAGVPFSATDYPELFRLLGVAQTPDLRNQFVRAYDSRVGRAVGDAQSDAGRNITGNFRAIEIYAATGAFYVGAGTGNGMKNDDGGQMLEFDASRVWGQAHTADEFRPMNVTIPAYIKHD